MRVALVQFAADVDAAANRASIASLLADFDSDSGLDLVVLPEAAMFDFGSTDEDLAAGAEPLDGPFVQFVGAEAQRLGATIVAGMFEATGSLPFNTLVVVGPDGSLKSTYRKIHLYDSFGYRESDRLSAGDTTGVVLDLESARTGLMTCYDLRFPEHARLLMDDPQRPDLFVIPAAWVAGEHKVDHWRTLVQARAIENTVYVVAVGQGGDRYSGHSLVVNPMGIIIDEAGPGTEVRVVDITIDDVEKARKTNPSLENRRLGQA